MVLTASEILTSCDGIYDNMIQNMELISELGPHYLLGLFFQFDFFPQVPNHVMQATFL